MAPKPTSSRAPLLVAVVVALVAAAAIIAVVSSGGDDKGGESAAGSIVTGTVTVVGTALPAPTEDFEDDPAVGRPFPAFEGQDLLDGAPLAIPDDGTPKLVIFVAHWCPHCQAEVPRITDWLDENGFPEGVDLYAVSTGVAESRGNYPPASWLQAARWPVPTMADSEKGAAAAAAGLSAYPFFVVVGADGNVLARDSGELSMDRFNALVDLARSA